MAPFRGIRYGAVATGGYSYAIMELEDRSGSRPLPTCRESMTIPISILAPSPVIGTGIARRSEYPFERCGAKRGLAKFELYGYGGAVLRMFFFISPE